MANILDLITIGEKKYLVVDADPALSAGTPAEVGSLAVHETAGNVGKMYLKVGSLDTAWDQVSTAANGSVKQGNFLQLPIYDTSTSGFSVDDVVLQNSKNISVGIVPQASRSANITYNIPNPGDDITSADFVLSQGAQTIAGVKTFSNDAIFSANLTVNGSLTFLNSTNTNITDALITLNKNGAAASASGAGIEFEENALITGYIKMSADRTGYDILPSATTFVEKLSSANLSAARVAKFADTSGTFVMRPDGTPGVASQVAYYSDANNIVSASGFTYAAGVLTSQNMTVSSLGLGVAHVSAAGVLSSSAVALASEVSGVLPIANGGTNNSTAYTAGSVIFSNGTSLTESNASFFWDDTNKRLGIGGNAPTARLSTNESVASSAGIHVKNRFSDATSPAVASLFKARDNAGANAALASGDAIGIFGFNSFGATAYSSAAVAGTMAVATEATSDTARGTKLVFKVTPNTTTTNRNAIQIGQDGSLGFFGSTSGLLQVNVPATVTSHTLIMPAAQGAAATGLHNDGSGNLSWSQTSLSAGVTGVLPIANGGTNSSTALSNNRIMISSGSAIVEHSAMVANQIYFGAATTGLPAQSANLFWDITNSRLGVGTVTPARSLDINSSAIVRGALRIADATATKANFEMVQAQVSTTDATVTPIASVAIPTNSVVMLKAKIVGRRTGGTAGTVMDSAAYERTAKFKNIAGTVTIANLQSDYTSEDQAAFNGTIVVNGTNAEIQVKGAANNNMDWTVTYEVISL
ncbi:hypothetical protein UFOVP53_65 [uncultured Caudovirales phage]|uniref:Major tropism determinant N-terminal domain-containing protein n=1 Tax=uncultured Caudovirales phage TaxID=2100421 RepID=A0A6J5KRS0_9CAUD|nr:hypothetical protein UFOVP53_65 [uncultured Caudovirales phage]